MAFLAFITGIGPLVVPGSSNHFSSSSLAASSVVSVGCAKGFGEIGGSTFYPLRILSPWRGLHQAVDARGIIGLALFPQSLS